MFTYINVVNFDAVNYLYNKVYYHITSVQKKTVKNIQGLKKIMIDHIKVEVVVNHLPTSNQILSLFVFDSINSGYIIRVTIRSIRVMNI